MRPGALKRDRLLVGVGRHVDVGSRQDGEHEGLDESHQALEGVHEHQQHEPGDGRQARDEVEGAGEQGLLPA